jgi:hypothetical protein
MKTIIIKVLVVFSIILLSVQLNAQTKINKLEIEGDAVEVVTSKSMTADVTGSLSMLPGNVLCHHRLQGTKSNSSHWGQNNHCPGLGI